MTKAMTRGQRRRSGRARKANVSLPGQPRSPGKPKEDVRLTVILARLRMLGWADNAANRKRVLDQRAGYALGRLALNGHITDRQRQAIVQYGEVEADYLRAINAPQPVARIASLDGLQSGSGHMSEDRIKIVKAAHTVAKAALLTAGKPALSAVSEGLRGEPSAIRPSDTLVQWLGVAGNALAAHFCIPLDGDTKG